VSTSSLFPLLSSRNSRNPLTLFPGDSTLGSVRNLFHSGPADNVNPFIAAQADPIPKVSYIDNEPEFRWALLQDQMAFDKLHEGIKKFAEDGETLKNLLKGKITA
jgi:hypothetical protein